MGEATASTQELQVIADVDRKSKSLADPVTTAAASYWPTAIPFDKRTMTSLYNCNTSYTALDLKPPLSKPPVSLPGACESNVDYYGSPLFCSESTRRAGDVKSNTSASIPQLRLVILLLSSALNYKRRHVGRTTWLRSRFHMTEPFISAHPWSYAFVVGNPETSAERELIEFELNLSRERCFYRDILHVDVHEDYYNLTRKKIAAFEYLLNGGIKFDIVLKTDDDCYVNIQLVMEWLIKSIALTEKILANQTRSSRMSKSHSHLFYGGRCPLLGHPNRNYTSRWYLSTVEFSPQQFPPFCYGAGYFLSRELLTEMLILPNLRREFKLEDVHTGILVNDTGLMPVEAMARTPLIYNWNPGPCGGKDLSSRQHPLIVSQSRKKLFYHIDRIHRWVMKKRPCVGIPRRRSVNQRAPRIVHRSHHDAR